MGLCRTLRKTGALPVRVRRAAVGLLLLLVGAHLVVIILHTDTDTGQASVRWSQSAPSALSPAASRLSDLSSSLAFYDVPARQGSGPAEHCLPRRSIFFLKTHKCGSSTVQNILLRHGERHALNFVLPGQGNYLGSPEPFQSRLVPPDLRPSSGRFQVFTHHTRLNVTETQRVMAPDAAWVTIMRDPVTQFESMYDYIGLQYFWNRTLEEFIALPLREKRTMPRVVSRRIGPNQMTFDLGYDPAMAAEPRLVEAMLREVDQLFDLVMIMELMDESLVLLRRLMCWSTDDVVSLPKQERVHWRRTALSGEQRAALEEYLPLDVALYRHFRRRLADRVAAVPLETFLSQAETLVQRRRFWRQKCVLNTVNGFDLEGDQREFTDKVHGYQLRDANDWMCSRLGMAEVGYTDFLRGTQRQRLAVRDHVSDLLRIADVTQTPANQR